jgi:hypothetical protein
MQKGGPTAPAAPHDPAMTDALADRLASELRAVLAEQPSPSMVLFSAPAVDEQASTRRETLALEVATKAGLRPWPDWSIVRHGRGHGVHLFSIIDQLGETGRAAGVVVCLLAPLAPSLVVHARAVATEVGLAVAVVGETP